MDIFLFRDQPSNFHVVFVEKYRTNNFGFIFSTNEYINYYKFTK